VQVVFLEKCVDLGYWRSVPHKARILSVYLQIVTEKLDDQT
jgi:hypothetical protein